MSNLLLIVGGIALIGVAYYSYQRRKSQKTISKEEQINSIVSKMDSEPVDKLALSDVVNYFKGLCLKKGIEIPFIASTTKNGKKTFLLAAYNEDSHNIEKWKLISPESIDDELEKIIGNETLVVLS